MREFRHGGSAEWSVGGVVLGCTRSEFRHSSKCWVVASRGIWEPWERIQPYRLQSSRPLWKDSRSESRHWSQEWLLWSMSDFARGPVGIIHWSGKRHQFCEPTFESQEWSHPTYKSTSSRYNPIGGLAIKGNNCWGWRIARPLDDNGQEQGISCRSNRNVPHDNCIRYWIV